MAALTADEIIARQLQDEEDSLYAQQVAVELASSEQSGPLPGLAELDDSAQIIDLTADDSPPPALRQVYRRAPLVSREVPAPQPRVQGYADLPSNRQQRGRTAQPAAPRVPGPPVMRSARGAVFAEPASDDEERDLLEALERSRRDFPPWGGRGHGDLEAPLPGEGGLDVDAMSHEELVQLQELMGKVLRMQRDEIEHYTTAWTVDKIPQGDASDCRVCMATFKVGELARRLPCLHTFHFECIDEWLCKNGTCPICRLDVKEAAVGLE